MLAAAVLAAGRSTRMGSPKATLPDAAGRPFVSRILDTLFAVGLEHVMVVTGDHHDAIADTVASSGFGDDRVHLVRNPDPSRGQLSSLWTALDACGDVDGLLTTLVDVPLIAAPTVRAVVHAWRATRAPVVRPAVGPRRGHPVIFDRVTFAELRSAPLAEGARVVVRAHAADEVCVPVADPGCLVDVDTPADYEGLRGGSVEFP